MTTKTATRKTAAVTVTVINRGVGSIEIHQPGCRDLERSAAGASIWDVKASSLKDVVLDVYPSEEFSYDEANWADYAGDIVTMPCAPSLDGRKTKRNAEWARQYRLRRKTQLALDLERYPVLITMA